jgi:UDP-2,4-diacetamido-2,4,6-trideoxy-beta-L-altropyranose hydrolase
MGQALFFADAGPKIGLGHMVRCLSLADCLAMAGWRCTFVVPGDVERMLPGLRSRGHGFVGLDSAVDLLGPTTELRRRFPEIGVLVVDSYNAIANWEARQRDWAERVVVIDDLANRRHDCDVLVDQTPGRNPSDYKDLVPENCTILAGASFAMLRGTFLRQRHTSDIQRKRLRRIVVNFGGSDPTGMTGRTLRSLVQAGLDVDVDLVLGANSSDLAAISAIAADSDRPRVHVHQFVEDMAALFANADLAIGAGGSSLLEKCSLGLPSLIIMTASNQHLFSKKMADLGAAKLLGDHLDVDEVQLVAAITELAACDDTLAAMSEAAANVCDGKGGLRVVSALLPSTVTPGGDELSLRRIHPDDEQIIHDWQIDPDNRPFFCPPTAPSRDNRVLWLKQRLSDTVDITLVVLVAGKAAGLVLLDCVGQTGDQDTMEVSIIIATAYRDAGVGSAALRLIREYCGSCRLAAEVSPESAASARAFEQAGFERTGVDSFQSLAPLPVTP